MPNPISTSCASGSRGETAAHGSPALPAARAGLGGHARSAAAPRDAAHRSMRASSGLVRSIASAYCARSFVPIERKSASAAKRVRKQRRGRRLDHHAELDCGRRRELPVGREPRAARQPSETIGIITLSASPRTRAIARNCVVDQFGLRSARYVCREHPEQGSPRVGKSDVWHRLVAADVQRPDRQRPTRRMRRRSPDSTSACSSLTARSADQGRGIRCAISRNPPRRQQVQHRPLARRRYSRASGHPCRRAYGKVQREC